MDYKNVFDCNNSENHGNKDMSCTIGGFTTKIIK